jgi:PilZ domain-containing protein
MSDERTDERRTATRQRSFLRGRIYYNNRLNSVDCLIRDISPTGARLTFSGTVSIPDVVDLYIPQKEQTLRATVHWRNGDELGVTFADANAAATPQPAANNLAERVTRLEVEIAQLKRMMKKFKTELQGDEDAA